MVDQAFLHCNPIQPMWRRKRQRRSPLPWHCLYNSHLYCTRQNLGINKYSSEPIPVGLEKRLWAQQHLPPSITARVWSLGPTRWKDPLLQVIFWPSHMHADMLVQAHRRTHKEINYLNKNTPTKNQRLLLCVCLCVCTLISAQGYVSVCVV